MKKEIKQKEKKKKKVKKTLSIKNSLNKIK